MEARCGHFGVCGGCSWQDLDYELQLRHKQAQVADAIERLGRFEGVELRPIEPARSIWGYRNKVEYSWSQGPEGPSLGFHVAGRWDRLMAVETCHIASEASNEVRRAFERWAREQGLAVYDQRSGEGFLRHLVVREGRRTGQVLPMLVTAPGSVPGVDRLRPEQTSPVPRLLVAGDWTRTGWPATMEGAVRSGYLAAEVGGLKKLNALVEALGT